jgi:hypothetical protein
MARSMILELHFTVNGLENAASKKASILVVCVGERGLHVSFVLQFVRYNCVLCFPIPEHNSLLYVVLLFIKGDNSYTY